MRILMVNKFLYPNGGAGTYIFKLWEELQRRGHEVQDFLSLLHSFEATRLLSISYAAFCS